MQATYVASVARTPQPRRGGSAVEFATGVAAHTCVGLYGSMDLSGFSLVRAPVVRAECGRTSGLASAIPLGLESSHFPFLDTRECRFREDPSRMVLLREFCRVTTIVCVFG
jgi:hypothetical protein